uniref:Uncharacterized protein n=1 Tax=Bionectria ochroleuca TaxID=29856 RepID=A0A8H7NCY8_BIOOC
MDHRHLPAASCCPWLRAGHESYHPTVCRCFGPFGGEAQRLAARYLPDDLTPSANTFITAGSQSQTLSPIGSDVAVSSFSSISRSVGQSTGAPMSLDAIARGDIGIPRPATGDAEEDLFALPMSPRSPEMKKSPFSIL